MSRRLLAVSAVAACPWLVLVYPGSADLVFAWGLVSEDVRPDRLVHVLTLDAYLFEHTPGPRSLPEHLLAWPVGAGCYALAVASAAAGLVDREDPRLTAGLLLVGAVSATRLWIGLDGLAAVAGAPGATPSIPVGPLVTVLVVWWVYWPAIRDSLPASAAE